MALKKKNVKRSYPKRESPLNSTRAIGFDTIFLAKSRNRVVSATSEEDRTSGRLLAKH